MAQVTKISVEIDNKFYKFDNENPLDISIPLLFNDSQPNIFNVQKATANAYQDEYFVGDTRLGGSCNFENLTLNPHCNGTHTECVGHITHARISVQDCLQDAFMLAELISVSPENALQTQDTYSVELNENDWLITRKAISDFKFQISDSKALIIRTLPNDESKKNRNYSVENPPFFSLEAMKYIVELGVKHLLVDVPSLERLNDEGKLACHRIFWNVEQNSFEVKPQTKLNHTVTEMIYVSNEIKDGVYLLNLQIAPFANDASPSRPILFKLIE
jgi:kynurenine formamidase